MAGKYILRPLMPLKCDQRNNREVRLACRNECGMESIGLMASGWFRRAFRVFKLDCTKGIDHRIGEHRRIAGPHIVPNARHAHHALIRLRHATLDHGALLKGCIKLVDPKCRYRLERRRANLASNLRLVAQDQLECALVLGA